MSESVLSALSSARTEAITKEETPLTPAILDGNSDTRSESKQSSHTVVSSEDSDNRPKTKHGFITAEQGSNVVEHGFNVGEHSSNARQHGFCSDERGYNAAEHGSNAGDHGSNIRNRTGREMRSHSSAKTHCYKDDGDRPKSTVT